MDYIFAAMDRNTLIELGETGLSVTWYGTMIAIGILACFITLFLYAHVKKVDASFTDFCFYNAIFAIVAGLGGAALFQATYNYIANPEKGFNFGSGLTFIGGLIGGVAFFLIIYVFVRHKFKDSLLKMMPIVGSCVTIAHGLGRIGCFIAGCCYGKPTGTDFGCYFETNAPDILRHPTQLYEATFLLILYAVLTFLAFKKEYKYNMTIYLMSYGTFRFVIEYFRDDARGELVDGISPSQFWSIVMVLLGVAYIFAIKYKMFEKLGRAIDIARHNLKVKLGKEQKEKEKAESDAKAAENADPVSENEASEPTQE